MVKFIGAIIVGLSLFMFLRKNFGLESHPPRLSRFVTSLAGFPFGFYEAFFGSGNSIFMCALLTKARGFMFQQALGYSYILAFTWCLLAACIYIYGGHWNLSLMVPAAVGGLCGASLGSHIGVKKGTLFTKALFVTIGAIIGMKMMLSL